MERFVRIAGWAGVIVGLSGVLPGIFLLRGSMIELGMVLLLLGVLVLWQAAALEELRATRAALSRMVLLMQRMSSNDATQISGYRMVPGDVTGSYGIVAEEENDAAANR